MRISKQSPICNRGARLGHPMDPVIFVQIKKLLRKHKGACKSSWNPIGILKSFTLTILWNSEKSCEDLSCNPCTSTPRRSENVGIAGRVVRRMKGLLQYFCNQVWMKNGARISWNVTSIFETFKISCLMGGHVVRGDSENHSKGQLFYLVQRSNITPFLPKTCRDCVDSARKSYQVYSLDIFCTRWESGKETFWSQTLRNRKRWTHRKSTQKDSM